MEYIFETNREVNTMDYNKEVRMMLRTLADNPDCAYIKNFVRYGNLRNGQKVRVSLLIEIDKSDPMD